MTEMMAAVKVRGSVDVSDSLVNTMESLNLEKKNQCVLIDTENEAAKGMLKKAKDFITYGEVSEDTIEKIEEKAGEAEPGTVLSLTPPSGGFRSTKKNVNEGGALGERQNMDELLQKML